MATGPRRHRRIRPFREGRGNNRLGLRRGWRRQARAVATSNSFQLKGYGNDKSFRPQDSVLGQARATCRADPFSHRAVHHGGGVRPGRAVYETAWPGGRSLLQPADGGDFDYSGSRYWATRVAVPTRGTEAEGHPIAAPRSGVYLDGDDLAGVVGSFPPSTENRITTCLSLRCGVSGSRSGCADRPSGRLSKRRKRTRLVLTYGFLAAI